MGGRDEIEEEDMVEWMSEWCTGMLSGRTHLLIHWWKVEVCLYKNQGSDGGRKTQDK